MYTKSNSYPLQSKMATLSYKIMMNQIFAYSCMLVKIGRLISLYFIIIVVIHKQCKETYKYCIS